MSEKRDYYEVLGVSKDASADEIKKGTTYLSIMEDNLKVLKEAMQ